MTFFIINSALFEWGLSHFESRLIEFVILPCVIYLEWVAKL